MTHIGVVGISSITCPLSVREELTVNLEKRFFGLEESSSSFSFVLLSTCERVELYFSSHAPDQKAKMIIEWLLDKNPRAQEDYFYCFFNENVWLHLAKVTAGLESALLGETEIQGQVKKAYRTFHEKNRLNVSLHLLFQKTLKITKEFRTHQLHQNKILSLESVIFSKIKEIYLSENTLRILFVGCSKTNQSLIHAFRRKGFENLHLATSLSKEYAKQQIPCVEHHSRKILGSTLSYDVVICATKEFGFIPLFESDPSKKLIFDLSLPRTIDPELINTTQVCLYNIEHIGALYRQKQELHLAGFYNDKNELEEKVLKAYQRSLIKIDKERSHALCLA